MTLPPKDYIATRRGEIRKQLELLNGELEDLKAMESALARRHSKGTEYRDQLPLEDEPDNALSLPPNARQRFGKTIKQMILEALNSDGDQPAITLLSTIKKYFDADIERTSLSPQLSRLKADGHITAYENTWHITEKGQLFLFELMPVP